MRFSAAFFIPQAAGLKGDDLVITNNITALHRKLCRYLKECGIPHVREAQVGPYSLDCFSSEHNLGFEADGPWHGRRVAGDRFRDGYLQEKYGIRVMRLNSRSLKNPVLAKVEILKFVRDAKSSGVMPKTGGDN